MNKNHQARKPNNNNINNKHVQTINYTQINHTIQLQKQQHIPATKTSKKKQQNKNTKHTQEEKINMQELKHKYAKITRDPSLLLLYKIIIEK